MKYGIFNNQNGSRGLNSTVREREAAGVSQQIDQLLSKFETPFYLYELDKIRSSYDRISYSIPRPSVVSYILHPKTHPMIARQIKTLGCHVEVYNIAGLEAALNANFDRTRILFIVGGTNPRDLREALNKGVRVFSVGSTRDLAILSRAAATAGVQAHVILRVNPGNTTTPHFGVDVGSILGVPGDFIDKSNLELIGFHFDLGSHNSHQIDLHTNVEACLRLVPMLSSELGLLTTTISFSVKATYDFGTYNDVSNPSTLKEVMQEQLGRFVPGWRCRNPLIRYEHSLALVSCGATLVSSVNDVKKTNDGVYALLDAVPTHLLHDSAATEVHIVPRGGPRPEAPSTLTKLMVSNTMNTSTDAVTLVLPPLVPGDTVVFNKMDVHSRTFELLFSLGGQHLTEIICDSKKIIDVTELDVERHALTSYSLLV